MYLGNTASKTQLNTYNTENIPITLISRLIKKRKENITIVLLIKNLPHDVICLQGPSNVF